MPFLHSGALAPIVLGPIGTRPLMLASLDYTLGPLEGFVQPRPAVSLVTHEADAGIQAPPGASGCQVRAVACPSVPPLRPQVLCGRPLRAP